MFLSEALSKEVLHEEVYLIDGVELFQVLAICRMLFCDLVEVAEPQTFNVLVFHDIIKGPLFPAVLYIPIHLVLSPLLYFFFILSSVGILTVLAELRLLFLELLSLREHV